jgi:hypothetical protein
MSALVEDPPPLEDVLATVQPAGIFESDSAFDRSWDLVSAPAGMAGTADIATTSAIVDTASVPNHGLTHFTVVRRYGNAGDSKGQVHTPLATDEQRRARSSSGFGLQPRTGSDRRIRAPP